MTDQEYITRELAKAAPGADGIVAIKARGANGESRWVNLPPEIFAVVAAVAAMTPQEYGSLLDVFACVEDGGVSVSGDTVDSITDIRTRIGGTP